MPGPMELVIIGVVVLLIFGPKRLPELAKGLGRGLRSFKKELEGSGEDSNKNLPPAGNDDTIDVSQSKKEPSQDSNSDSG